MTLARGRLQHLLVFLRKSCIHLAVALDKPTVALIAINDWKTYAEDDPY